MSEKIQVVEGCPLMCSMGSSESCLKVPLGHGACTGGKKQATVMDYKPGINIISFGICKRMTPPQPCIPVILIPWLIEDKDCKLNGEPALFNTSVLSCVCGGVIRIRRPD
ncbi:DUF4280 domain-containing protein [Lachnospiraceae bacterium 54-53]